MKTQLPGLTAAALLLAVSAAAPAFASAASPWLSQAYSDRVQSQADALLQAAGIDGQGPPVTVRAKINPDGHPADLQILQTSGSPERDEAVANVLRKVLVNDAPVGLLDGAVTLKVG
ncbi:MAG TPA: TonB family protein [Phenylobacterium sp.]|jgi:TonB family protein|nr:TonB family protein [Phenylobacterium sp.]